MIQSLLWRQQSLAKLGLDSSAYIEGGLGFPAMDGIVCIFSWA
jgi:hypothetical protein